MLCGMWWSAQGSGFPPIIPTPIDNVWGKRLSLKLVAPNLSPSSPHFPSPHDHLLSPEFSVSLSKTLHGCTFRASSAPPMAALSLSLRHSRTPARASSALNTRTEPPPLTPPLPATIKQPPSLLQWQLSHSASTAQKHQPVHPLLSPLEPSHRR
uniref:Uncharacterized protein n=1 Tax=Fagus sylvatica TaxID=28930 RepID=A0A2N9GUD7_FAGSY